MIRPLFLLAACLLVSPVHAKGNAEAGKAKSAACAACHGQVGVSEVSNFPTLAGQHRDYLYHALRDYKSGKRKNPIMAGQVASLSDADMADLAKYYSQLPGLTLKY
jgi:cytochrome c553